MKSFIITCPRTSILYEKGVESCPTSVRDNVCYVLIWSWATPHIANWFYGGTPISSWYQSGLSSCEAKQPHALHVTQLLSTCRLENLPPVRGRVESYPTSVRDKVCYVLIWSWATPHIANWFYGGTPISSKGLEPEWWRRVFFSQLILLAFSFFCYSQNKRISCNLIEIKNNNKHWYDTYNTFRLNIKDVPHSRALKNDYRATPNFLPGPQTLSGNPPQE